MRWFSSFFISFFSLLFFLFSLNSYQRTFLFLPYTYTDLILKFFPFSPSSFLYFIFSTSPLPIFLIVILSSLMSKSILPLSNLIKQSLAYHLSSFFSWPHLSSHLTPPLIPVFYQRERSESSRD